MANMPLQSISFPGLSDKYTTPTVDSTLTQTGAAADAKKTGDEIGAIKNDLNQFPNGNYPQMGVGYANQLVSGLKKADQTPYNFRAVPYDATLEEVKKIVGGTVAWNQLVGTTDTSITVQSGHKAYKSINGTASVFTSDGTAITVTGGTDIVIDLTQMLGTTIADYVYNLDTATAGAGVAWLKTHFPKQFNSGYQAYDAGTLKSIEGLVAKKTVGFNQFDEELEVGAYSNIDGTKMIDYSRMRCKDKIQCVPNTAYFYSCNTGAYTGNLTIRFYDADENYISYYDFNPDHLFTTPNNCHYITFYIGTAYGTTYNHDICINLSDPTKNGTYEPYEAHSYALDNDVVLRGIPKVDANGNLYYDGDEYLPDGTVNRRYGVVDLGTLTWTHNGNYWYNASLVSDMAQPANYLTSVANIVSEKYTSVAPAKVATDRETPNIITNYTSALGGLLVYTGDNTTQPSGIIIYEKATPTTETADPYQTPQIISPDGTEEYVYEDGAFELPVGHSSDYPVDVSGQLDDILDTPPANGTYVLKATVTDGAVSYSWVADA